MKRFFTLLLVASLVLSPSWCLGKKEANLKTIFLGDNSKTEQTLSSPKQTTPLKEQISLMKNSKTSTISQENSNLEDMTTDEIVDEIIAKTDKASDINRDTLKSLVTVKAVNTTLKSQIVDAEAYTTRLETNYQKASEDLINSNLDNEAKSGEINTLNEKLKQDKNFKFALAGVNYNTDDGYGVTLDTGVKFSSGLMTSVGVSAPADVFTLDGALDIDSYTFNTKIGWAW